MSENEAELPEAGLPEATGLLGQTAGTLDIADRERLAVVSLALAAQAQRSVDIVSRHLDPALYDTEPFAGALRRLALGSRHARIRLLVLDVRPLVTQNHRLVELAVRLPSFVSIRVPAAQHRQFNEALLVADKIGYVHRVFSDRYEAEASFADRRVATRLSDRFEELWTRALPEPNFRKLQL